MPLVAPGQCGGHVVAMWWPRWPHWAMPKSNMHDYFPWRSCTPQADAAGNFQENPGKQPAWPKGGHHMLGMCCAQVGVGIVGWRVTHGHYGGTVLQYVCPISLRIQVARIGQYLAEFSNLARLVNTQPLLQAHGGPQLIWWPSRGLW